MVIRRLEAGDEAATRAFFERIPEADQRFFNAVAMFQGLGFYRQTVLPGHVRDREGNEHDLVLLANTGLLAAELQGATT